jgi:hypothetical protein
MTAVAPQLDSWEFHPAKPSRDWSLVFTVVVEGEEIEVDANTWEFVVYKFKDDTCDLVFKPDKIPSRLNDSLDLAGIIIANGELGEEKRIDLIERIEVVEAWDERAARAARRLAPGLLADVFGN